MITRNYGRPVLVVSIAGNKNNPHASACSISKAAVVALAKSLGKELAGQNIAVNFITPTAGRTRIFDQMSEGHIGYMLAKIPRGRFVEISEIAAMMAWLASEENSLPPAACLTFREEAPPIELNVQVSLPFVTVQIHVTHG